MDLLMVLFLAFAMCMMLASLIAGGFILLNKQQATEAQPLLSKEDLDALEAQLKEAEGATQYSNVLGARTGFDSGSGIIKSMTLAPPDCQALCGGTKGCQGFQISGQNSCDLLANVSSTYAFIDPAYNIFVTPPLNVPREAFNTGRQGEIVGKEVTAAPSPAPMSEVKTKQECAKQCRARGEDCKSFSVSEMAGCKLKSALNAADGSLAPLDDDNWVTYFKKDVKHSTGWSWTPAPSPNPR